MNERKNVVIGKIGKSIKFKGIHIETGGDACLILYSTLARINPEYNFYFIGPNGLNKLTQEEYEYIFPNKNVFNAYSKDESLDEIFSPTIKYFEDNNIKIDFALLMNGMVSSVNVPNFVKAKNGNYPSILMAFKNYAGPYIYALNKLNCPLFLISEDARYISVDAKDLCNREHLIFSQINKEIENKPHIKSESDHSLTSEKVKAIYSGVEKIFLMGCDPNWRSKIDINRKLKSTKDHCLVLSNGVGQTKSKGIKGLKSSRYDMYKKWIIDGLKGTKFEGTKIYGVWDDEIYEKYHQIQNKMLIDLTDEIADAKYTLVYSMMPGFVTVKPWEMIVIGLIPFIHPYYDKYRYLNLPKYCYVNSIDEFKQKMEELDNNPDKYIEVLNACFDCIKEDDITGKTLNNFLFNKIAQDLKFNYESKEGVKPILNRFSKNMF